MDSKEMNYRLIDRDMLKYLAIIPMTIGHFCSYLNEGTLYSDMHIIEFLLIHFSLFAPPIFFFFIAEGFRYTRSRKKYALRLLLFAVITQIPFVLANEGTLLTWAFFSPLNIIFTLFIGLIAIMISQSELKTPLKILFIVLLDAATFIFSAEWMIFGILMMLVFYKLNEKPQKRFVAFVCVLLAMQLLNAAFGFCGWGWTIAMFLAQTASCIAAYFVIDRCYNGEKGKHPIFAKWFFYIFYPAHLLIIFLTKYLLGKFEYV